MKLLSLDGLWRLQPDTHDDGENLGYHWDDYDHRLWRETMIPSCFDTCLPELEQYLGVCWYRIVAPLAIDIVKGHRYFLCFEAVNNRATVWVNGIKAGMHRDPFLPFDLDITDIISRDGIRSIAVRADNRHHAGDVPGMHTGWHQAGGIVRSVALREVPKVHVGDISIVADHNGHVSAQIRVAGDLPEPPSISAEILDANGSRVGALRDSARADGTPGEFLFEGELSNASVWSPESPTLYTLSVSLGAGAEVDRRQIRFGFRTVKTRGVELLINGTQVYLTGFNRHDDSPKTGFADDPECTRRDLEEMKKAGANAVRLSHYPHSHAELDLCDELGLLAFCEIPLYFWNDPEEGLASNHERVDSALRQLQGMIKRDRNHPSVIIWSVSNETNEEHEDVAAANRELIRTARSLDPSRLCVHVSDHWKNYPNFDEDDVICINSYPSVDFSGGGRRPAGGKAWRDDLDRLAATHPGKPILVTEFGFCSLPGTKGHAFGEDVHAEVIETEFEAISDHESVCGSLIWCWADHPWPCGRFLGGTLLSPFGVVSRERRKLAPFFTASNMFRRKQGIEIPHPPEWPGGTGVVLIRPDLSDIPEAPFPDGYELRPMSMGESGLWTDIQRDAEQLFPVSDTLFQEQFGYDPAAVGWRCFILRNEKGLGIGTISAWYSRDFRGEEWGRIHWVALRPAYQGRGLSNGMLAEALKTLAKWHDKAYLDTDTRRVAAIALYLKFGFLPDLTPENARRAWTDFLEVNDHPAVRAALDL